VAGDRGELLASESRKRQLVVEWDLGRMRVVDGPDAARFCGAGEIAGIVAKNGDAANAFESSGQGRLPPSMTALLSATP